jgi:type I restriction enzyme M protein
MASNNSEFQRRLWEATDQLRASEYSLPVLGLIFLKYADCRFERGKC